MKTTLLSLALLIAVGAYAEVTIIDDVRGYTSTDDGILSFSSVAFDSDGRIVGTDVDASEFDGATIVDGRGRVMLPGITDAHAHVSSLGVLQVSLDLFGVNSLEECVARIKEFADNTKGSGWVKGRGWNQVLWPSNAFPTAADIDAVVPDRPVFLRRVDGHAGWANSKALQLAGIDRDTPDPVGGKILRDDNGVASA